MRSDGLSGHLLVNRRRRRVLIIVENLPVPFDRRVWQEATTLQAAGYDVSVISPKRGDYRKSYEVLEGVHVYRHPLPVEADGPLGYAAEYAVALFFELVLAVRVALTRGVDVIHACNPPDLIFLVALPFKLFGKKFVFDHHDINPELYEAKFGKRDVFYRLLLALERSTYRVADRAIATNDSYRRIAVERGGKSPAEVAVVRSGPSLERMRVGPPVPKWRFGKRHLVGYVGVIGKQEGVDMLLRAARHVVRDAGRDDVHFTLVGGGTELENLKRLAHALELDGDVTFTGRLSDEELLEVLNTADVCVNPDVVNEMNDKSTMNKIMEYMALGKPVVQFDTTEGRVSAAGAALYARPNDPRSFAEKLIELLDDPEKRAEMGRIGRARIERELSWDHQAPKLLEVYARLFGEPEAER
ncbi:MAG: glycosyltransferase family 4 protein [Gammaproteobacteria bacterium]